MYLFFRNNDTPTISPVFSGTWQNSTQAVRRMMSVDKNKDAITTGTTIDIGAAAGANALDRQYVTPGLAQGQFINGFVSGQLMVREEVLDNDFVDRVLMCMKLVSNDGQTIRGTLLNLGLWSSQVEFLNSVTCRNKTINTGTALNPLTALEGDRIVIEIGYGVSVASVIPKAGAKWGAAAPLLPVEELQTTDGAGWIQISPNLKFRDTEFFPLTVDD